MDFRQYNPALGRFSAIDAAAELAQNWTPYRFAFNNPILYADPTGLWEVGADGSWNTNDEKDIERFMNMLGFEADFYGGASGAQIDTFISEEFRGSGGRLSDGSALLDSEVIKGDSNGNSNGFSPRQEFNISKQVDRFVSNPWNEKSMGKNGGWAYSYKYYRERSYYENGGEGMSGVALSGAALSLASDFMGKNGKFWFGKNFKFYDSNWGGNGYTGGKNKFAGKWANRLSSASSALGIIGMYSTYEEYQQGKLSGAGATYLGLVDAAGTRNAPLAMWSLGTGIGKYVVERSWYFNAVHNDINW